MSALLKQAIESTYPTVTHGRGVYLYDTEGREYLDGSSGAMTASLGHGLDEIADAMSAQARRVAFVYRTQFTSEPAEILASKLTSRAPAELDWAYFVSSGSEASEMAIRAAVMYWRERGEPERTKVLGRQTSYHGMTLGSLSLSGQPVRRRDYGNLIQPFAQAPDVHVGYARPGESEDEYARRAAEGFEATILANGPETVAAIIAEPIVGAAGGVLVPPRGYFARLREMCDRYGVLLILDEVITGVGRTGNWFASLDEDVIPDMLLCGKGLSGGYAPVAAVLFRDRVVETLKRGSGLAPFAHTFSANPVGAAVCVAVLDYIEREDVLANVRSRGAELASGLSEIAARHPMIADVRGRGLLWGFEFTTDPGHICPPSAEANVSGRFVELCMEAGLIVYPAGAPGRSSAIILSPPLVITTDEVRDLLGRLETAAARLEAELPALLTSA